VPAAFRSCINEDKKYSGIVVYRSFINPCIEATTLSRMEYLSQTINAMDPYSESRDAFATAILGGSLQLPFDNEGRIILNEELMQEMSLTDSACFVGKGVMFEIWQPETFKQYFDKAKELAKQQRSLLQNTHKSKEEDKNA
jgi:MraZ protein